MDPAQQSSHIKVIGLLQHCGDAALSARDEKEFFKSWCDIVARSGLFQFAWFGCADESARKIVRPLVHSEDHSGFLEVLESGLHRTDYEDSSNIALLTGKLCWIRDLREHANPTPIQSAALERGYTSVISMPVNWDHRPHGALTLYYSDPDCFGQYVPDLLTEWLRTNRFEVKRKPSPHFGPEQYEAELRALIDVVPQHIVLFSADIRALHYNRVALDYYGRTLEEILTGIHLQIHPDDLEEIVMKALSGRAEGVRFEFESRLRRHDGEFRWFSSQLTPLRDEQGTIIRWCGIATDIHDRKLAEERLQIENIALREEVDRASMFEEIVGTSRPLKAILSRIAKVAPTDSTVLISGETGTGKELIARAVHKRSQRSGRPFVTVNCAALPPTLVASELFGHEKGAFTGATQRRYGRFEMADGGTIFLDEVGELLPDIQSALLRVLQEREFERLGGGQTIHTDVRVIAATNRDLNAAVANGKFRRDLLYRLNVFPIEMPPLRERKDDILILVEYFVQRYANRGHKNIRSVDKKTLDLLQSYDWPGNVRELQNIIERSIILSTTDVFSVDELWLSKPISRQAPPAESRPALNVAPRTEREIIEAALAETRGRVSGPSGAAAKLGIPQSTLATRIKVLRINKHQFKFRRS
jgi:PAS domain S-box-containing protein